MSKQPVIELFIDPSLDSAADIRSAIRSAMSELVLMPDWKEYYPEAELVPTYLVKSGINSLAINGIVCLQGMLKSPTQDEMVELLRNGGSGKRRFSCWRAIKNHFSFLMAVVIGFFPKCPFCWAAYMSLLSAWGIKRIPYQPWLLPVFCILLLANIVSLYMTRKKHHYGPLLFSIAGAFLVIANRYWFEDISIMYAGVALLVAGSLWNSLSKRMASSVKHYFIGWRG
ncbi:MAG: MerC domain-containing protein [Chitinophagaceae bacterium]